MTYIYIYLQCQPIREGGRRKQTVTGLLKKQLVLNKDMFLSLWVCGCWLPLATCSWHSKRGTFQDVQEASGVQKTSKEEGKIWIQP
jgi:hypothetical protein